MKKTKTSPLEQLHIIAEANGLNPYAILNRLAAEWIEGRRPRPMPKRPGSGARRAGAGAPAR